MNKHFEPLISEIKRLINHEYDIFEISLINPCGIRENDIKDGYEWVRLSNDKTKIICQLYEKDTIDIMADKLMKAESLMDEALKYKKYKEDSPYLHEALEFNIPELKRNRTQY